MGFPLWDDHRDRIEFRSASSEEVNFWKSLLKPGCLRGKMDTWLSDTVVFLLYIYIYNYIYVIYVYIYIRNWNYQNLYISILLHIYYICFSLLLSLSLYSFVDLEYDNFISFLPTISNLSIFPAIHLFIYPSIYLSIWTVYVGYLLTENGNESNNKEPGGLPLTGIFQLGPPSICFSRCRRFW